MSSARRSARAKTTSKSAWSRTLESSRVRHAQQDRLSAKQLAELDHDLRWMMGEDLITHLGNEYY